MAKDPAKEMGDFIYKLSIRHRANIKPFLEANEEDRQSGFRIVKGELPFVYGANTHYLLLFPMVVFAKTQDTAYFICGSLETVDRIVNKMEFNAKMPAEERIPNPKGKGLVSREDFDKMWNGK